MLMASTIHKQLDAGIFVLEILVDHSQELREHVNFWLFNIVLQIIEVLLLVNKLLLAIILIILVDLKVL